MTTLAIQSMFSAKFPARRSAALKSDVYAKDK